MDNKRLHLDIHSSVVKKGKFQLNSLVEYLWNDIRQKSKNDKRVMIVIKALLVTMGIEFNKNKVQEMFNN
jgi:hypothetical protein